MENYNEIRDYLMAKGMNAIQANNVIRKSYQVTKDEMKYTSIKKDGEFYVNKNIESIMFSREDEALFFEFLFEYVWITNESISKSEAKEKAIKLLNITNSLLNVESEWKF